jgi:hypothetical protein|tara:strand:+ start:493 stop:801 length:309 start_codon:yes stop_codon:yes gene_type:complete
MNRTTNTSGTSLQGHIESSYGNMVYHLGTPNIISEDNKTDVEWGFKFSDGTIVTIYNYKDGKNYLEDKGKAIEDLTIWHIGGHSKKAYFKIQDIIESKRIDL